MGVIRIEEGLIKFKKHEETPWRKMLDLRAKTQAVIQTFFMVSKVRFFTEVNTFICSHNVSGLRGGDESIIIRPISLSL